MLAFWTRGFPCQNTGKENLWCPEYPAPVHGLQTLQDAENDDSDDIKIYNTFSLTCALKYKYIKFSGFQIIILYNNKLKFIINFKY